jgi:hypothetical protein
VLGAESLNSQPRPWSSDRIRRRIMASGTRVPRRMYEEAAAPRGVPSRIWARRRSPEDRAASCGYRPRRRADCVPFPTPGGC